MRSLSFKRRWPIPENRLSPPANAASAARGGTASGKSAARTETGLRPARLPRAETSVALARITSPIRSRTASAAASASADGQRRPRRTTEPPATPPRESSGMAEE